MSTQLVVVIMLWVLWRCRRHAMSLVKAMLIGSLVVLAALTVEAYLTYRERRQLAPWQAAEVEEADVA